MKAVLSEKMMSGARRTRVALVIGGAGAIALCVWLDTWAGRLRDSITFRRLPEVLAAVSGQQRELEKKKTQASGQLAGLETLRERTALRKLVVDPLDTNSEPKFVRRFSGRSPVIDGIVLDNSKRVVLIGNRILQVGDEVDGAKIVEIGAQSVVFAYPDGSRIEVFIFKKDTKNEPEIAR